MKQQKTIEVAGQILKINELSALRVMGLLKGKESILSIPMDEIGTKIKSLLPLAIEGDLESLMAGDLYYDDLKAIYGAFKEVNPLLVEMAREVGLNEAVGTTLKNVISSFSSRFSGALNPVIEG